LSDARSKVTRRPRSKLERVLDAIGARAAVVRRPEVDLGVQLALACLVSSQASASDARDLVRRLCDAEGHVDPALLIAVTDADVTGVCPPTLVASVVDALHAVGHLVGDGALDDTWDPEDTRRAISGVPGMIPSRADYLLLSAGRLATVAPSAHVMRVAVRVGYPGSTYGAVARALDLELPYAGDVASAWRAQQLLDQHGRAVCTAVRPSCGSCPIREGCSYAGEGADPAERIA
jgi:endonuclease III